MNTCSKSTIETLKNGVKHVQRNVFLEFTENTPRFAGKKEDRKLRQLV